MMTLGLGSYGFGLLAGVVSTLALRPAPLCRSRLVRRSTPIGMGPWFWRLDLHCPMPLSVRRWSGQVLRLALTLRFFVAWARPSWGC